MIGKDAEREVAEGTDRAGAMMFISQAAHFDLHDWRAADKSPLVFMAYMNRGREEVEAYAKTAQDLGFAAVGITMDTVKPVKIGDEVPLSTKDGKPRKGHKSTPKDIEWMKQMVKLPVVVKGIMGADDAKIAVNSGADAVMVSNHGGRILDFNRSALEALPEVVDAVGAKVPVLLDSGIRSGGDIVKALALGAKAVLDWPAGCLGRRRFRRARRRAGVQYFRRRDAARAGDDRRGEGARRDPGSFSCATSGERDAKYDLRHLGHRFRRRYLDHLDLQHADRVALAGAKRLAPDQRPAQAALRFDSQFGRNRQRLHAVRTGHTAKSDRRAQQGDGIDGRRSRSADAQGALTRIFGPGVRADGELSRLKSNQNVLEPAGGADDDRNQIAFSRQYYNDLVTQYNTKQQVFPANMIAGFFQFQPSELFAVPECRNGAAQSQFVVATLARAAPTVDRFRPTPGP